VNSEQTVLLEPASAYIIVMCCKNSQEIPEDEVDERRIALKLRSD
jgi:hypothetical protein